MSAWTYRRSTARPPLRLFHLVFEPHDGRAFCADSEEKREPVSDIDTAVLDSLKVLDPNRPIREADIGDAPNHVRFRGVERTLRTTSGGAVHQVAAYRDCF